MKKLNSIPFQGMLSFSRMSLLMTVVLLMSAFMSTAQTTYYVNDNSLVGDVGVLWAVGNNGNSGTSMSAPKLTIQAAINAAASGDIIVVAAGTYSNSFAVTKSLTIRGAYFGQSAPIRGPSNSDESVISGGRASITIAANNVVIDGFTLSPTSSRMIENPNGTGLTLTNNVVFVNGARNNTYGILDARTNNISGLTITNNLFQCQTGTGGFIPVFLVRSTGALTVNNAIITGNSFVNTAHGILMNRMNVGSMSNVLISGNNFNNIQGVSTGSSGGGRALQLIGLSNSTITRNTFNNVYHFGVQLGAASVVSVSQNNFTGSSVMGVQTITSMSNVVVTENNFSANFSQKAIVHAVGSGTLDATCNWFGANVTTTVTNSVSATGSGGINTLPWLTSGTDSDLGIIGFQPATGTCSGGQSTQLSITSAIGEDIYCSETGAVDIEFTGGTGPFSITWPNGSDSNISSPFTIPNMPAGTNNFIITDATNASVTGSVTLVAKKVLNASWGIGYTTIQAAINAASPGDVLTLCSGTYAEKLSINKSLTILGPNANISPNTDGVPSSSNPLRYEEAIIMPTETTGALLTANASSMSVVIKGIVFDRGNGTANTARFIEQIDKTGVSWVLENNIFKNAPYTINGNFYMTGTSTGMSFQFNNNRITNNNGGNGIALWGTGSTTAVGISNNVWYNNSAWAINANSVVGTINNNYFVEDRQGASAGTWSNFQNGFIIANENNNLTISGNTFTNLHSGINIYRGDANANNHFRGTMAISNNFFNTMHSYAISGRKGAYSPDLTNVTVSNNSFVNAPLRADTNVFTLNATCNWFNSLNAQTIASGITGNVSYSPWLVNGTDDQPATMGFQPVTGTCTGTAPSLSSVTSVPSVCFNAIGSLTATFSNGTAPYAITLNTDSAIANATSPHVFSNLAEGTYTITITDANGSTVTSTATVALLPVVVKKSNNSLTGYSSISDAISNANTTNGDTLYVCPGTYSNAYYNVTKSLTIKGAKNGISGSTTASRGSNEAILSNARFEISANNVTIDGFTFVDGYNRLSETSGIYIHGSKTGLVFTNNIFTRSGLFGNARAIVSAYNQPTQLTISNNLFTDAAAGTGKGWSSGMYLNPGAYGTISNNVFEGLNVAMSVETPNVVGLTISNNTYIGSEFEALGLNHVGTLVTLTGNSFEADNAIYMSAYNWGTGIGNAVDATNNTFAGVLASNLSKAQAFDVENKIQHSVDSSSPSNPLIGLIRVKPNQVYVTSVSGSINRGITAASIGDTVNVSPETYSQNVLVNKSVYLHGANAGLAGNDTTRTTETKILDGQLKVLGTGSIVVDGFDFYQTTSNFNGTISLTTGNTPVTIQNCIIERWATTTGNTVRGIETSVTTAPISITNNLFRGDGSNLFSQHKTWNSAIYSNGGTISITNNEFKNTRTAINSDDMSNSVVINNNTFGNNGTAISFGGTTPTAGSYAITGNSFNSNPGLTLINLSNVNTNFRLDATANSFYGKSADSLSLAEAFVVESNIAHKGRVISSTTRNGMVRIQAGKVFNTTITTVANNILYADANDTLFIDNGTYDGAITINKKLDIRGQGTGTIIKSNGNTAITYTAEASGASTNNMAYLRNLRITGSTKGILASQLVNNLSLNNLLIDSISTYGIHINNVSGIMNNWSITNCTFNANGSGYYGSTASNINNISITGCTFSNQVNSGIYVGQSNSTPGNMSNVTINGNTFTNNGVANTNQAAMYIEKMTNASITNNTITNNGLVNTNPRGIILNLKYADFSNISILGNTVTESRSTPTGGYGIQVAARNDASSYNTLPASLTGLTIANNVINSHFRGITIDNAVNWDSTSVMNNALTNCHYGILTTVYGAGNTANSSGVFMRVENNSIVGSDSSILNFNLNGGELNASCNWFGSNVQQNISNLIAGNVNFSPWLLDGIDSDTLAVGFQTTSSCSGATLEIAITQLDSAILCKDQTKGYLDFNIVGGIAPYTISLNGTPVVYPNNSSPYVNDTLPKGAYTVILTDSIGSVDSLVFNVSEPDSILYLSVTPNHPLCFGETGTITFNATGGTSPIAVDIDGALYGNSGTEMFASNTYTVIATDANNCTIETEVTLNDSPDELVFDNSTISTNATCSGLNGQLNFNAIGGNGNIVYSLTKDVNEPFKVVSSPVDTVAGTYIIKAVDANNCSITTALTIEEPLAITFTISSLQNANCYGEEGSFNFKANGGESLDSTGFIYTINADTYLPDASFNGLAGIYTVVATDIVNNCSASTIVEITEPQQLILTATPIDASCFGNDGYLSFSSTGGTGSISFDVNLDNFYSNTDSLPRPAGNYTIIATDANGCSVEELVDIFEPQSPLVFNSSSISVVSPACFGGTGELIFEAEGGTGLINYSINSTVVESPYVTTAGTYNVLATDANGCTVTTDILLEAPTQVVFDYVTPTHLTCYGNNTGELDFAASGGTGSPIYGVNGDTTFPPTTSLSAGSYTISVTDENNCTIDTVVVITEPDSITITYNVVNAFCLGEDGSITFSAVGGTGFIDFSLDSNPVTSGVSLPADTYTLVATDDNACQYSVTATVTEPSSAVSFTSTSATPAQCKGDNGMLTFVADGGTGTITYTVNGDTASSSALRGAGTYTIVATDVNGCSASTELTITEPDVLSYATDSVVNASCYGSEGSLYFALSGGTTPYTYTVNSNSATSPSLKLAGTYTVNATDANNCSLSTIMEITQPSIVILTASKTDAPCNSSNGELTFDASGGTGLFTFTVNGLVQSSPFDTTAGTYTIVATDANGCSATTELTIAEPPAIVLTTSSINAPCNGENGKLYFSATGGSGTLSYLVNGSTQSSPYEVGAGTYTVQVSDASGCSTTTTLTITEPDVLSYVTDSVVNASCFGSQGSLYFAVTGGTLPYSYTIDSNTVTSPSLQLAGTYTVTAIDVNNCSLTTILAITEPSLITTTETVTSCDSYTWPVNNATYSSTGVYQAVLNSANGCDSVVNLDLTIVPYTLVTDTVVAFQSYTWRGNLYTASGTYFDTTGVPSCTAHRLILTITTCGKPTLNVVTTTELSATLSWTGTIAPNYRVEYALAGTNNWTQLNTSTMSITINGLTHNTSYDYRVRALCGLNSISEWSTDTFKTNLLVCNAPTFNTTTSITFQSAIVNWTNTGAGTYLLRWRVQGSPVWTDSATINNTTSRSLSGLLSNTTYEVSVRSRCLNVINSVSSDTIFTTATRCGKVQIASATPAKNSIVLNWNAVPGALNYNIQRKTAGQASFTVVTSTATGTSRTIGSLAANTTYTIRIRSNCGNNNFGEWSDTVITTLAAKSEAELLTAQIGNFEGQATTEGNNLTWSTFSETNCREMILQHSTNGSDYTDIASISSLSDGGTSEEQIDYGYLHTTPSFGTNFYRLKSISYDGDKYYHNEIVTLSKSLPTTNVVVYPNPTRDVVNLDFYSQVDNQVLVKVLDMTGRVVKTVQVQINMGQNTVGLGIGEFPQGIYSLQLYMSNQLIHVSKIYRQD